MANLEAHCRIQSTSGVWWHATLEIEFSNTIGRKYLWKCSCQVMHTAIIVLNIAAEYCKERDANR